MNVRVAAFRPCGGHLLPGRPGERPRERKHGGNRYREYSKRATRRWRGTSLIFRAIPGHRARPWRTGPARSLHFEVRSLHPEKFSYPYHLHRNAEDLFVLFEGEATLRSPEGYTRLAKGDIIFFKEGPSGTHQLYNHGPSDCVYLDIRTRANVDVCEYPDSGKINILPAIDVFKGTCRVPYYTCEEQVREKWPEDIVKESPSGTKAKSSLPE